MLQTSVVVDYQNVHLVGAESFEPYNRRAAHEALVHPGLFARRVVAQRNAGQDAGAPLAQLARVLVYRGLPSNRHDPEDYSRNLAQKSQWERDALVHVTHRPLRYDVERDATGRPAHDINGREIVKGKREKGIDVLCALALVREAARPGVNLVILASHDTDLVPALDEARDLGHTRVETFRWQSSLRRNAELKPDKPPRTWCTRLGERDFIASLDRNQY